MAKKKIKPVKSLGELKRLAASDQDYDKLMKVAAENLGGDSSNSEGAYQWLLTNAMETSEEGVVEEVNFCRDFV